MKKRKLELYITGELMSALMVGRPAIFSTGGEMQYRLYVGDVEWQKLKTALALKPSVQM